MVQRAVIGKTRFIAGLALCLFGSMTAHGAEPASSLYRFAPRPAWVAPIIAEYDARQPANGGADGEWYLLLDRQIDVGAAGDELYRHVAVKVLSADGVAGVSQIDFPVDPTYQALVIHSLQVVRGGRAIDQQPSARITALPQETALQARIYNGGYNINVLLSDVRPDDIVEYEYTLQSREINFPGHFATTVSTAWSVPLHRQHLRIRYPATRAMRFRSSDGVALPAVRELGALRELDWQAVDATTIPSDPDRPSWYATWPYIEASDLPDWPAVSRLVSPLFDTPAKLAPGVAAVVNEVRAAGGTPEQQALHALQYVQEQVRYTSISIGPGAYRPTAPSVVLARRFGDCKDKTLLLATILQALGIDARPALINTDEGRLLERRLPTPYAFDHAIVRVAIGGNVYWLDPTAAKQYSPLSVAMPPDFERALPLGAPPAGLEDIPRPSPQSNERTVTVELNLRKGIDKPGRIDVTTRYQGPAADRMRPQLATGSREQRQADYVNYLAKYYSGVRVAAPLTVRDDTAGNTLEVREHYIVDRPFRKGDDGARVLMLHADELYQYADTVKASVRKAPLAIEFPAHVTQTVIARLPEDWTVDPGSTSVRNPAFEYHGSVAYANRTVTLRYEYLALQSEVPPAQLARYLADRKKFYDDIGLQLTYGGTEAADEPASIAPLPLLVLLLALMFGGWSAWRWLHRYDPDPHPAAPGAPVGIRGWLLVPAFNAALLPVALLVAFAALMPHISVEGWSALTQRAAPAFRPTAHVVVLGLIALQMLLLVWSVALTILFFQRRTSAPRLCAVFYWLVVLVALLAGVYFALSGLSKDSWGTIATERARGMISAAIWSAYLLRSQRVHATFRNRLRPAGTAAHHALPTT